MGEVINMNSREPLKPSRRETAAPMFAGMTREEVVEVALGLCDNLDEAEGEVTIGPLDIVPPQGQ
jgi:hypothetical protein